MTALTASQLLGALLVGVIPSLLWFFFWTREDHEQPEPKLLLAGCFLAGMIAVILAIPVEGWLVHIFPDNFAKYVSWSAAEEILKFIAVIVAALFTRWNDEPIDTMIYCIAVALGFAALENTFFVMTPLSYGDVATGIIHGNLRAVGATLVHVVSSALLGFSLSLTFYRPKIVKFLVWLVALAGAITVHAAFNLSILGASPTDTLRSFGWIWGAVVVMIILFEEIKAIKSPSTPPALSDIIAE